MLRIEIEQGEIDIKGGTIKNGERAGQSWEIRSQKAWMYNGDTHPVKITLNLPKNHAGYAPGSYYFAPQSFGVGEYYAPKFLGTHYLVPVESAKAVKAS